MPMLKGLNCTVRWSGKEEPLEEYSPHYADGRVSCSLAIPDDPPPFLITLSSEGYIAPGLAMFVYIDGVYQCNRNRRNLKIPDNEDSPKEMSELRFVVRQKEEFRPDGTIWGRPWHFKKLNIDNGNTQSKEAPCGGAYVGTIEVVVLRCVKDERARSPETIYRLPLNSAGRNEMAAQQRWIGGFDGTWEPPEQAEQSGSGGEKGSWGWKTTGSFGSYGPDLGQDEGQSGGDIKGKTQSSPAPRQNYPSQAPITDSVNQPNPPIRPLSGQNVGMPGGFSFPSSTEANTQGLNAGTSRPLWSFQSLQPYNTLTDNLGPKPYWASWKNVKTPKVERQSGFSPFEEPQWQIPTEVLQENHTSHQLQTGKPAPYIHKLSKPKYIDTHARPYAVFQFKYRDTGIESEAKLQYARWLTEAASLDRMLGCQIASSKQESGEPSENFENWTKEQLIEELRNTKASGNTQRQAALEAAANATAATTSGMNEKFQGLPYNDTSSQSGQQQQQQQQQEASSGWNSGGHGPTPEQQTSSRQGTQNEPSGWDENGGQSSRNNQTGKTAWVAADNENKTTSADDWNTNGNHNYELPPEGQSEFPSQNPNYQETQDDSWGDCGAKTWGPGNDLWESAGQNAGVGVDDSQSNSQKGWGGDDPNNITGNSNQGSQRGNNAAWSGSQKSASGNGGWGGGSGRNTGGSPNPNSSNQNPGAGNNWGGGSISNRGVQAGGSANNSPKTGSHSRWQQGDTHSWGGRDNTWGGGDNNGGGKNNGGESSWSNNTAQGQNENIRHRKKDSWDSILE